MLADGRVLFVLLVVSVLLGHYRDLSPTFSLADLTGDGFPGKGEVFSCTALSPVSSDPLPPAQTQGVGPTQLGQKKLFPGALLQKKLLHCYILLFFGQFDEKNHLKMEFWALFEAPQNLYGDSPPPPRWQGGNPPLLGGETSHP